ncbi:hypothetical protein JDV02_009644 [Purpureocillium takamizusanense]|uniref:Uncharacterized protein n=1 Tax=Purpureocillium takamizusanense TaxID=2060973 RepID=A0A9Q8QS45_9HYPO|nr:uncharacterized protein JDV02_009644 [Purpureocillium takamizusanense]UNI23851.1 hypothetical protein JDV02_009644 [Purpureocillium takamizusanense]
MATNVAVLELLTPGTDRTFPALPIRMFVILALVGILGLTCPFTMWEYHRSLHARLYMDVSPRLAAKLIMDMTARPALFALMVQSYFYSAMLLRCIAYPTSYDLLFFLVTPWLLLCILPGLLVGTTSHAVI